MNANYRQPRLVVYAGLLLSGAAATAGYFVGYEDILPSIIAALILVGPSLAVAGFVVSAYMSLRSRRNDGAFLSIALWQLYLSLPLATALLAIVNSEESANGKLLDAREFEAPPGAPPLEGAIRRIRELQALIDAAIEAPVIERNERMPWRAEAELFEFPNFTLVSRCMESMSVHRSDAWVSFGVEIAREWYETVAIQLTMLGHGAAIAEMKAGVVEARTFAELQRTAFSGTVTVEPSNYFHVVQFALNHALMVLQKIQHSRMFSDGLIRASSQLAIKAANDDL